MRILVTGAGGFLGAHLVRNLLVEGHEVLAGCHLQPFPWRLRGLPELTPTPLDVTDPGKVHAWMAASRPEAVVHCAAHGVAYGQHDAATIFAVNVAGTQTLLEAAAAHGVQRFVQIGSCFEYGHGEGPLREEAPLHPRTLYGMSKAASSRLALALGEARGLPTLVVRPFGLWGEMEDPNRLVPAVVLACLDGRDLELTEGEQRRDYLHVEDAVVGIVRLLTHTNFPPSDVVNLGSGHPVDLRTFVTRIATVLGGSDRMRFGRVPYRPDEMMSLVPAMNRLRARITTFDKPELFTRRIHSLARELKSRQAQEQPS